MINFYCKRIKCAKKIKALEKAGVFFQLFMGFASLGHIDVDTSPYEPSQLRN